MPRQFIRDKRILFITAIDIDGTFDCVNHSISSKKLHVFGSGLVNLYSLSVNSFYSNWDSNMCILLSGIKQGLLPSPYLFLLYIDDMFEYLDDAFPLSWCVWKPTRSYKCKWCKHNYMFLRMDDRKVEKHTQILQE